MALLRYRLGVLGSEDAVAGYVRAAYAPQRVVDLAELEGQLALVAHVPAGAAAAAAVRRAAGRDPVGGGGEALLAAAVGHGLAHLDDFHAPQLAGQHAADKDRLAVNPAHAHRLGGEAGYCAIVYLIFSQCFHAPILPRSNRICNSGILWYNNLLHPNPSEVC